MKNLLFNLKFVVTYILGALWLGIAYDTLCFGYFVSMMKQMRVTYMAAKMIHDGVSLDKVNQAVLDYFMSHGID